MDQLDDDHMEDAQLRDDAGGDEPDTRVDDDAAAAPEVSDPPEITRRSDAQYPAEHDITTPVPEIIQIWPKFGQTWPKPRKSSRDLTSAGKY